MGKKIKVKPYKRKDGTGVRSHTRIINGKKHSINYEEMKKVLDLLAEPDDLEDWLYELADNKRKEIYNHKILEEFDIFP